MPTNSSAFVLSDNVPWPSNVAQERMTTIPSLRFLWKEAAVVTVLLLAQLGPAIVTPLTMLLLAVWSLRSTRCAFQALTVSVIISFLNPNLSQPHSTTTLARWVLLLASCGSAWMHYPRSGRLPKWALALLLHAIVLILLALGVSAVPSISIVKTFSYVLGASTAMLVTWTEDQEGRAYLYNWFATLYALVIAFSIPLLFLSQFYFHGTNLFCGLFSQPQVMAVYIVSFPIFCFYRVITGEDHSLFSILLVIGAAFILAATHSRTAILAILTSLAAISVVSIVHHRGFSRILTRPAVVLSAISMLLCFSLALAIDSSRVEQGALRFLTKNFTAQEVTTENINSSFQVSRGGLALAFYGYFKQYPLTGIGFGMASERGVLAMECDPIFGIPISSPEETGVIVTTILGQTGIIGSIAFLVLFGMILSPVARRGTLPVLALFFIAIMVNFGEMVFFAMGGMGLQIWLLLGLCHNTSCQSGNEGYVWN